MKINIEKSRLMKNGQRVTVDLINDLVRVTAWGTGLVSWYKVNQMRDALREYDRLVAKYVDSHIERV